MLISHFTDSADLTPHSVSQREDATMKPKGLWVSVDGEYDWPSWCSDESFRDTDAQHQFRVTLIDSARILILEFVADITRFQDLYGDGRGYIHWSAVARTWSGIIISPYQWEARLGSGLWYYGWDCASGCIWDASAIESVDEITERVMDGAA